MSDDVWTDEPEDCDPLQPLDEKDLTVFRLTPKPEGSEIRKMLGIDEK